jgi:hypothetical protein
MHSYPEAKLMTRHLTYAAFLFLLSSASRVTAEDVTIHLKTGEVLTGHLSDIASDHVTVDLGSGSPTTFARSRVESLERDVEAPAAERFTPSSENQAVPLSESMKATVVQSLMTERADWESRYTGLAAPVLFTVAGVIALGVGAGLIVGYNNSGWDDCPNGSGYGCEHEPKDRGLQTGAIGTLIGGGVALSTGFVLWLLRTSDGHQQRELERIDGRLKNLGVQASLAPFFCAPTEMAGTCGGLKMSGRF